MHTQETNDFAIGQKLTEAKFKLQQIDWKLVAWVEFSEGKKGCHSKYVAKIQYSHSTLIMPDNLIDKPFNLANWNRTTNHTFYYTINHFRHIKSSTPFAHLD